VPGGRSIRIARLAGIPIGVNPLWLAIVGLITWSLAEGYFPDRVPGIATGAAYALGLASALLLFASILLHELGHAIVARRHGVEVEEIDLWLLGGVARMRGEAHRPQDELRYALAGPAVTATIAVAFGVAALALSGTSSVPALRALVDYQAYVNVAILVFNLMPAFPLDGGRVLRALLWRSKGDRASATAIAARWGRGFGWMLVALGLLGLLYGAVGILWLGIIGLFIVAAANAEERHGAVKAALSGRHAAQLMSAPAVSIPAELSVEDAVRDYFGRYPYTAFPIADRAGHATGIVTVAGVEATPAAARSSRAVDAIGEHDPDLLVDGATDVAELLDRPAFARVGRAVVVDAHGEAAGVLSITDVQRALRSLALAKGGRAAA